MILPRNTVKSELNSICRKPGAFSRIEAVARAGILAGLAGKEPGFRPFIPMRRCSPGAVRGS